MTKDWLTAALALLPPLFTAVIACGTRTIPRRFVAVEFASSLAVLMLIALSFAFDQASSIDVALTLALLTLPGTLVLALFTERWI
jgi:multicomponent Na+:H+ antiporter subunit F